MTEVKYGLAKIRRKDRRIADFIDGIEETKRPWKAAISNETKYITVFVTGEGWLLFDIPMCSRLYYELTLIQYVGE